jgi:hypothetical protein
MIKKIPFIFSNPPELLLCYRGSPSVKHMLKLKYYMHSEKNATASKFEQFLPIENGTFWVKISSKNVQDEDRLHFCAHNDV